MKSKRLQLLLLTLGSMLSACGGGGGGSNPSTDLFDVQLEAIDLGAGTFEVHVRAKYLGALAVAGIAMELDLPGLSASYVGASTDIGSFFQGGQLAAGFRADAPETLAVGAAIPPTVLPSSVSQLQDMVILRFISPVPASGNARTGTLQMHDLRLYARDATGGFASEIVFPASRWQRTEKVVLQF